MPPVPPTPGAYVLRLTYGACLLRATMAPLATVARQVGYSPSSPSAAHSTVSSARRHATSAIPPIVCHIPLLAADIEVMEEVEWTQPAPFAGLRR